MYFLNIDLPVKNETFGGAGRRFDAFLGLQMYLFSAAQRLLRGLADRFNILQDRWTVIAKWSRALFGAANTMSFCNIYIQFLEEQV